MKIVATLTVILLSLVTVAGAGGGGIELLPISKNLSEGGGGQAHIEIYEEGDRYHGKIIWLSEPVYLEGDPHGTVGEAKVDTENPDEALRSQPIVGLLMMSGFKYDVKGLWHKGKIYDPDNGKTYKAKLSLTEDDVLKVRGFIGFSLIGRTSEWTRFDPQ